MTTATKSSPYQGSFFFVNHDANNLDARSQRKNVCTHVQRQYHKWNRQERVKAFLSSTKAPLPIVRLPQPACDVRNLAKRSKAKRKELPRDDDREITQTRYLAPRGVSPVLLKGDSDPFDTHATPITPEVNQLITFFRDLVIPSAYYTGPQGWKTSKTANAHWQSAVQGLGDEGSALAFLARYAHIAAIVNKDQRMICQALRYTSQSITLLRERLEEFTASTQEATLESQLMYWQINLLWGTEILNHNLDAAVFHARMLLRLTKQSSHTQLDTTFLRYVMYNDSHLISLFMIRSVFDYDVWIPEQYKAMEAMVTPELPKFDDAHAEIIDPSVENELLKQIFTTRREHVEVWKQRTTVGEISPRIYAWLATVNSIHQGQLVKIALDAMEMAPDVSADHVGRLWNEACLSLATLYWIRSIGGSLIIRGIDVYNSQKPILKKLRGALNKAQEDPANAGEVRYQNARLWALFIGAQAEQSWKQDDWYCANLSLLGKKMGLTTWPSIREVLKRFLYTDMVQPHGSTWYETIISQEG